MMPLSFAPIEPIVIDGVTKWNARCRACGEWVCEWPQVVKTAVDESRRAHGPEKLCTRTAPGEPSITIAEGLLPTLEGHVHGIVGRDPWWIQCDACGAIEEPDPLVNVRTVFNPVSSDPRRLCPECQEGAGW